MNGTVEEQLLAAVGEQLTPLWERFVATEPPDLDQFVVWLRERGAIDAETARGLLLAERLEISGGGTTENTLFDALSSSDAPMPVLTEGRGHTQLSKLGAGAMGEVHLVRDEALRRKVALKRITGQAAGRPDLAQRFVVEAQITAQLEHPNIIPVYSFERDEDGVPAYSMKLIQGQTLTQFLRECRESYERGGQIPDEHRLQARLEPFLKVCDAVAYAHDRGVLHRDLKPDNIMLGPFGEVVVMDWGIARVLGTEEEPVETLTGLEQAPGSQLTRIGQALGTPAYMSPEQANGLNDDLDGRSDQAALGLILFEICTLERAYRGTSAMVLLEMAQQARLPPVKPRIADVSVPRELAGVVHRATSLRRSDRYADVGELALDIRRFLRGDAVLAAPDSLSQRLGRWVGRHRQIALFSLAGLALLAALTGLGSVAMVQSEQAQAQHREARLSRLLGAVGGHAHGVDAQLLRYTALLEGLGATARATLARPAVAEPELFRNADFAEGGAGPEDSFFSDRYYQRVSFGSPVLKLAPGVDATEVGGRMQQLASTSGAFRELFLRSHAEASVRLGSVEAEALLRSDRVPVVWSYIAVEEGIHTSYPGHGGYPAAYDPRQRPWYLAAREVDGPQWGSPYVDINGLGLILPCNLALRDRAGELLGVAGLELTFGRVIRDLVRPDEVAGAQVAYLVDPEGKIVVSSAELGDEVNQGDDLSRAAELLDFPEAQVVEAAAAHPSGTLQVGDELFAWTRLVTIDWTYVVRGPAVAMVDG